MERLKRMKLLKSNTRKVLSLVLIIMVLFTSIRLDGFIVNADEMQSYITLYLIDNTSEKWIANNAALIELVDNSSGHDSYMMTKVNSITWSVNVPESAYNITFNRYNQDKTVQWNSWSAGGRDSNNAYYVDGSEYGHWEVVEENENYFHAGDIIYLDTSEFTTWENNDALMYINFTEATKSQNGGKDINIANANNLLYSPKAVDYKVTDHVYAYIVTKQDEGKEVLRFWRGNSSILWNCSVLLTYENYSNGIDCVKVTGWNEIGNIYQSEYIMDVDIDTDQDGLPDFNEIKLGTDKSKVDTDGDGLNDYYEVCYGYSPLMMDTDNNGINDGDEDYDNDKLKNVDEFLYGTDMALYDTDNDGISDYDEIFVKYTNPLSDDTDEDGVKDGDEIDIGTNPLLKDTDGNGIDDKDEVFEKQYDASESLSYYDVDVYPTITVNGTINVLESVNIDTRDWDMMINCNIPGYIGTAYEFTCSGSFDSANVTFNISEDVMKQDGFVPAIYYYNEEEQYLEKLDNQIISGNTVSASLEHFSSYIVLNSREFDDVWNNDIMYYSDEELQKPLKIGFAVDCSSSMSGNDPSYLRNTVSNLIIEKMSENDSGFVVFFNGNVNILQASTPDKTLLKTAINSSYSSGMTALNKAVNVSINQFTLDDAESCRNILVVLSDGYDTEGGATVDSLINLANNRSVKIYTIGLGSNIDTNLLVNLAEQTGGNYYYATTANDLEEIYTQIGIETVNYTDDSNNDGITDYHTKLLCEGKLRLGTGIKILDYMVDKNSNEILKGYSYEEIQSSNDLDNDGLKNGEEIQVVSNEKIGTYVKMISNPTTKTSDMDNYSDYSEVKSIHSNALKDNIVLEYGDINFVGNYDNFYSSLYKSEYSESLLEKGAVWVGNYIYGSNYDKSEIYEDMLTGYFSYISENSDKYGTALISFNAGKSYIKQINSILNKLSDVAYKDYSKYEKLLRQTGRISRDIESLLEEYSNIKSFAFIYENIDEIEMEFADIMQSYERLYAEYQYDNMLKGIFNTKITIKYNIPEFIRNGELSRYLKGIGYVITYGGAAISCTIDGMGDYNRTMGCLDTIQNNMYILKIIQESNCDKKLRKAAENVEKKFYNYYKVALNDNTWDKFKLNLSEIGDDAWRTAVKLGGSKLITVLAAETIWIDLAIVASNGLIGVSDTTLKAVKTYGAAYMAEIVFEDFNSMEYDGYTDRIYYQEDAEFKFKNVVGTRIYAEQNMIAMEKTGTKIVNYVYDKITSERKKIINDCNDMIADLTTILDKKS